MHPRNKMRLLAGLTIDPVLERSNTTKPVAQLSEGEMMTQSPDSESETPTTSQQFTDGDIVLFDDGIYIVVLSDPKADMVGVIPAGLADASGDEKNRSVEMVKPDKLRKPTDEERKVMARSAEELATVDDDMDIQFSMEGEEQDDTAIEEKLDAKAAEKGGMAYKKKVVSRNKKRDEKEAKKNVQEKWDMEKAEKGGERYKKKTINRNKKSDEKLTKKKKQVKESTHNYKGHQVSHEDTESDPINVVGQGEKQWANSLDPKEVKTELNTQLDNRGDQSMNEYDDKVKVPAKLKNSLSSAITSLRSDAERMGSGHTAQETKELYMDTADAFEKILTHFQAGTIMELKQAQIFATTLMGPMLHKLPDGVWDFITNGGQKRSLKDYMNKVGK